MNLSFNKLWKDYGIGAIIVLLIVAYGVSLFVGYLSSKGMSGYESNETMGPQYKDTNQRMSGAVTPAESLGHNEVFSEVNGIQTTVPSNVASCAQGNLSQNPENLLPLDSNSQWAQLNPAGKGELSNVNLLKAGYHIGIDTVGQTLRNANLQIRSEPPNPQLSVGPWNQSTIEPDFMRVPLEIGAGPQ
jgi:hypothetical protein